MIQLTMAGCGWSVQDGQGPDGSTKKMIVLTDPQSGISVLVPLDDPVAHQIGALLQGKKPIEVAQGVPEAMLRNGKDT